MRSPSRSAAKARTLSRIIAVCALTALVCTAAAAPVAASAGQTYLLLELWQGTSAGGPVLARVALTCDPDGGTHPQPVPACTALRQVDGLFERLPGDSTLCPLDFDPVTAVGYGRWRGHWRGFDRVFDNRCLAGQRTNGVFRI